MIRQIAEFFDTKLALTGWVEKFFPLVKQNFDGDKGVPEYYKGRGQYEQVSNFDNWNGMAYLRLTSSPSVNENTDNQNIKACANAYSINYPLRLVFCIKRSQLKLDDAFAEDRLVTDLIKALAGKNGTLKSNLRAMATNIVPESWTTESVDVIRDEYPGRNDVDINMEFIYGAINFNVSILIDKNCITDSCEDNCYAYQNN